MATEHGLEYVLEGERIDYTITVNNTGHYGKEITIQDTIPQYTTLVDGSIKINGQGTYTKDQLESGIQVNIAKTSTLTLTFSVTADELPEDTYERIIRNTAVVDGTSTTEVTVPEYTPNVEPSKSSEPASGKEVIQGQKITYTITLDNSKGTAPGTVKVQDTIPTGTTLVDGSIKVDGAGDYSKEQLEAGFNVTVAAKSISRVTFEVTVNDLDDLDPITNVAKVDDTPTDEVTHTYIEPIISAVKSMATEYGKPYVAIGEKITYTITITNEGHLGKNIVVTDQIPEGTTFVQGSVRVNDDITGYETANPETGINVNIPKTSTVTVSFEVEVVEGATEVKNTAVVDGTPTNEVKVPTLKYEKKAEIVRLTEEEIPEGSVTVGDKIIYTITLQNLGEERVEDIIVKDVVPEGTTLDKINNEAILNANNEIEWNIGDLEPGQGAEVSFEVIVNYIEEPGTLIRNVATVSGDKTNITTTPYETPEIKEESTIEKTGTEKITSTEETINYSINYNVSINDFLGEGKITIVDYLPYALDMGASNLVGGIYDSETRTITWEQELGAIDTFRYGEKEVNFSRDITVKYIYDDEENLSEPIENRVEGTVTLTQGGEPVVEDTKEDTHETIVEIPAKVIVHHYIYDEEKGGYTDIKIAPDEEQNGLVGDEYSTHKAEVGADYECINETPDKYQGTMTKTDIEVIYYYELKDVVTESTITKDATASTETEIDGQIVPVLTDEDGEVTYNITYTVGLDSYQGKVTLQLVDYLPYAIDTDKSNLSDGTYNPDDKTITWTIEKDIDTFTQGKYSETINKQITVVYKDQDVNAVLENRVVGKLTIYYPEEHSTNPGGVRHEEEKEDTAEVVQDYKVDRTVTKVWDHTNNIYTIPSQIKLQVKNGEEVVREQVLTEADKTAENTWTYTFANLDKYDAEGNEINYTIDEVEVEEGDLGYYRKDIEGLTIKNTYIGPIISQVKTAETENGLDYVLEGEKVKYTITVRNDGQIGKDVLVQDEVPEGTTLVDGSIKVDNADTEYTADSLTNGITVNVAGNTSVTVTFEVTVNELPEGIFEYIIRNTAIVDGKPTEEVTEEVNKPNVIPSKSSTPDNGTEVKVGDPITYTITLDNSKGTAPDTVVVKDNIPEGTTFVEGSIKINDVPTEETAETLANGIEVHLNPAEIKEVEFQVTVKDLDNGTPIRNVATVDEEPTNEITHTYIEPIISGTKEMTTQRGLSYVIPGEEITYTIKVKNEGDLGKNIVVQDTIPEGTEFANGSVLLDGQHSEITKEQLEAGINIEMEGQSEHTVSFKVIVQEGAEEIRNTATVDGTETNETKKPVLDYEKTAEIVRQTEEELPEGTATAGDKIRYTIKVSNLGEEATESIEVKDVVPEGTTLSKIENSGKVNDKNEITWTIESIAAGEYAEVSFEVTINYDIVENKVITNIATVDGEETNETDTPYDKPEIKEESSLEKTGTEKINSTQEAISYKITYNAIVKDFVGEGRVTIVDYLPYEIEEEKSELNEGIYDANAKTITWEEDLGTIDTYLNGEKDIEIIKDITVKYVYGEAEETLSGTIPNRVTSNLELRQEDPENPEEDKTVLEDPKEDTFETKVEVPTEVIVHHYIEGTTIKVPSKVYGEEVEDEIKEGYAGEEYTTAPTANAQENYKVVGNSGNTEGIMTQTPIEVIYYYQLQPGDIVENTITKDGTDRITNRDDKVSYTIVYTGEVRNYVGNAKVEIIDYLPYAIDESVSNIAGGTYNPETKTITWIEDLGRVNTYVNGDKEIEITKNIEVVYAEMDYRGESFINKAQGKITLEETNQEEETPEAEKETETELEKDLIVEKEWDDNEDIKGRRPESVTIQLTANGKVVNNINDIDNSNNTTEEENNDNENTEAQEENNIGNTETQGENSNIENVEESNNIENTLSVEEVTNEEQTFRVVLNEANNWIHTFENLPKYTEDG